MPLSLCIVLFFAFYKLGSYNARFPGQSWIKVLLLAERLKQWLQAGSDDRK